MADRGSDVREPRSAVVVARWPAAFSGDALELRARPGYSILLGPEWAWLWGPGTTQGEVLSLARLRGVELFYHRGGSPSPGDALFPLPFEASTRRTRSAEGRHLELAGTRVPEGDWLDLHGWRSPELALERPPALQAAKPAPLPLKLVRGGLPKGARALVLPLEELARWATAAPAHRLEPLCFAVDGTGRALILGDPLPPTRGSLLWGDEGVLIPCGMTLEPAVSLRALRAVAQRTHALGEGDTLLVEESGWSTVHGTDWVKVNRSSVRATAARRGEGAR